MKGNKLLRKNINVGKNEENMSLCEVCWIIIKTKIILKNKIVSINIIIYFIRGKRKILRDLQSLLPSDCIFER